MTAFHALPRTVLIVTELDPFVHDVNGFTPRLRAFLAALSAKADVDLVVLEHAPETTTPFPAVTPEEASRLRCRRFRAPTLPASPLAGRSARVLLRKAWQYTAGRLPDSAYPRRVPFVDELVREHGYGLIVYYLPPTAHLALAAPLAVDTVCVLEEGLERRYLEPKARAPVIRAMKDRFVSKGELRRWSRLYRRLARRGSRFVAISEAERPWFAKSIPPSLLTVLPHGVDLKYFQPDRSRLETFDVAVFGDYQQQRNREAVMSIMAAGVGSGAAAWRWAVVGRQPDPPMEVPVDAEVTGFVADVRPFYARARVVVVPAFGGSGVKTTLLQAWAMGCAVVTMPNAVRGVPAVAGENVLVAESVDDVLVCCNEVLRSEILRDRLRLAARRTAEEHCDVRAVADRFAELCVGDRSALADDL